MSNLTPVSSPKSLLTLSLVIWPFFNGVKSTRYQPVVNSESLMVLLKSKSFAFSQPSGTSGVTIVNVSTSSTRWPFAKTRIYAVSIPLNLSPYWSHAILIMPAVIESTRLWSLLIVIVLSTVTNAGHDVASEKSTLTDLPARFCVVITRFFSKFL